jgi:hypothetical protein
MRRRAALLPFLVVPLVLAGACREPTQIEIEVLTDLSCPGAAGTVLVETSVYAARPGEIDARVAGGASNTSTRECTPGTPARVGSLVFLPSGAQDEPLALRVYGDVSGACGARCIEAKRSLRYQPHRAQKMQIVLRSSCMGVKCGAGLTCVRGSCVDEVCPEGGCSEEDLLGQDAGVGRDASLPDALPLDGPALEDAPPLFDVRVDAPVSLDSGGVCYTSQLPANPTQIYHFDGPGPAFAESVSGTTYTLPAGTAYGPGACKEALLFQNASGAAVGAPLTTKTDLDVFVAVRTLETDVLLVGQGGVAMTGWVLSIVAGRATLQVVHGTGNVSVSSPAVISDAQWHLVRARWNAAQMSVSVDGSAGTSFTSPAGPLDFISVVRFGEKTKVFGIDEAYLYAK